MIPEGIGGWIQRRARSSRGAVAVMFRDHAMTYEQLAERVDRLADGLQERGIAPGDRVAYLGNNHPSFIEAMFASALLGAIFVPLNTRLTVPELAYMLADSGACVLLSTSTLEAAAVGAAASIVRHRVVVSEPYATGNTQIGADAEDYETVIARASASPTARPRVSLDDDALMIYTSGTTGKPKGAVLTHGSLTWNAINVITDYDLTSSDRALIASPLFHAASLGMGCLPVLLKGATVLLEERFVPSEALASIVRHRATTLSGVPTTYQLLLDDPRWQDTDISSVRLLTCGGSAVPERVREAYESRGLAFTGGYGMTEASPGVTMLPPKFSSSKAGSVGLAHSFSEFRIRRSGALASPGENGEIETRGPNLFVRYWGKPEATADAFTEDGWFKTGDIGYTDDDGFLYIADRLKDMIISGGENIYSAEVEAAILLIPGVTGVAVIGVPHEKWGEAPHAYVTLIPGAALDPQDLVVFLSDRLARYKVPRTLEVLDALPRTATGKVQKYVLRQWYAASSG